MKKIYIAPEVIELIAFRSADVITLSEYASTPDDPWTEDWD